MDIEKLKAFIVVAEELNFRKSAEILGMSQPPLTRLISSLEAELSTKLFERTTRSVQLTGAGVVLLKEARDITSALLRIQTDVRAAGKLKSGQLRIGFSRTAFLARFPALLEEFEARFPQIKVELLEESNQEIFRRLKTGRLDLVFSEALIKEENIKNQNIATENVSALLPKKHNLAKRKSLRFHELSAETVILHSRKEAYEFQDRISFLTKNGAKKPKTYIKAPNESCPILVAMGKGISLTLNGAWSAIPQHLALVPVEDMFVPIKAFWQDEGASTQLKTFLSFIFEKQNILSDKTECLVLSNERPQTETDYLAKN